MKKLWDLAWGTYALRLAVLSVAVAVVPGYSTQAEIAEAVVHVSPEGSDETGDGSVSLPWRTIGFAMRSQGPQASAGHPIAILLAAGEYREQVVFEPHIRLSGLQGDAAAARILPPSEAFVQDPSFAVRMADDTALEAVSVTLPAGAAEGATILIADEVSALVSRLRLDGGGNTHSTGIRIRGAGSSGSTITSSWIENLETGIWVQDSGVNITRNVFEHMTGDAVHISAPAAKISGHVPTLGDMERVEETGTNCFREIGGSFVRNLTGQGIKAEICYWNHIELEEQIAARLSTGVDFVPFLRGPTILAASMIVILEDAGTSERCTNATITINPPQAGPVTSNSNGVYVITSLVPGAFSATIEAPGYEPHSVGNIEAPAGGAASVRERLTALPGEGQNDPEMARQLIDVFDNADEGDARLSFPEAAAAVDGLTRAQFGRLDLDQDNYLTLEELTETANTLPTPCCNCQWFGTSTLKDLAGDILLFGLVLLASSIAHYRGRD